MSEKSKSKIRIPFQVWEAAKVAAEMLTLLVRTTALPEYKGSSPFIPREWSWKELECCAEYHTGTQGKFWTPGLTVDFVTVGYGDDEMVRFSVAQLSYRWKDDENDKVERIVSLDHNAIERLRGYCRSE